MVRNFTPRHLLFTFLFLFPILTYAQQKNFSVQRNQPSWLEKIVTTDKKPSSRDIKEGYYLSLWEQQNNLASQESYQHAIRQIVSDNGVQNGSEITVTYDPSYQKLVFHKVIIWRDHIAIDRLEAARFKVMQNEKELSKFIYSGTYDAYLILDDVRKGDRIEFAYTIKGQNPVFGNRYNNTFYLEGGSKISNIYLNLIVPKSRVVQIKNFNDVPKLNTFERGENRVYSWQNELTKTYQSEDFEPSWYDPYARIQVSEIKTWKEIVDWAIQLNRYDLKNASTLNNKIKELKTKSNNNLTSYFELATRFVQDEIRYMGIEMGEYSHRPNSPEKVLKQRYGDCKDKSLLLIELLKANGITAYPVYVNTYLRDKTKDILPTTGAFNHAVVLVEYEGKKIWIDPTMTDQRGPIQNIYFPYNANLLVVKPGNDKLEWVKSNPTGKTDAISVIKVADTTAGKKTELKVTTTYTANCADQLRGEISSSGLEEIEKNYLEYYTKYYPGVAKSKDIEVKDDEKSNTIILTEHYDIEDIWEKTDSTGNKFQVYFYGDLVNNELRSLKRARPTPFALKYPANVHQVVKLILPERWNFDDEDIVIDKKEYYFKSTVSYNLDTVVLDYTYKNKSDQLAPESTKQYVKDLNRIKESISYYISWNGATTAEDGDTNGGLLMLSFGVWVLGIAIAIYIYRLKEPYNLEEIKNATAFDGWLIFLMFGIVASPIALLSKTYTSGTFTASTWDSLPLTYGKHAILMQAYLIYECITNTLLIVASILVAFLYFGKRKILPKTFIILKIASISVMIIDVLISYALSFKTGLEINIYEDLGLKIVNASISVIWIFYFLKSEQVKTTFVFTYPSFLWKNELMLERIKQINVPHSTETTESLPVVDNTLPESLTNLNTNNDNLDNNEKL